MKTLITILSAIFSLISAESYSAAVVEYYPIQNDNLTIKQRLNQNAEKYVEIIASAAKPLDIIVFPENTLQYGAQFKNRKEFVSMSTLVPSIEDHISPCDYPEGYSEFFVRLSCAARKYQTYLSINLNEKSVCLENCASDNWNIYDANVVFDRNGSVIAKYRKFNLYGEYGINATATPEIITFETDFNVTFGTFICFDILFEHPVLELIEKSVKHFIYSSMWFSELPFLTAPQVQQMWAAEYDVVLLASGSNNPGQASGGSGIYQGKSGALEIYFNGKQGTHLIQKHVRKHWNAEKQEILETNNNNMDDFLFWNDNLSGYSSSIVNESEHKYKLCSNNFCCDFILKNEVRKTDKPHYIYQIVAYNGLRSFGDGTIAGIQVCALVACLNQNISSCTERLKGEVDYNTNFEQVIVKGYYDSIKTNQFPVSLMSNFQPAPSTDCTWTSEKLQGSAIVRTHSLKTTSKFLHTFGIYGRHYVDDSMDQNIELNTVE